MIPEGWEEASLGELTRDQAIGTGLRGGDEGPSLPLLKMGNILWGGVDLRDVENVGEAIIAAEDCRVTHGDILFNTRNTPLLVGKTAFWHAPFEAAIDNNIMRIRLRAETDSAFVARWMGSNFGRKAIGRFVCASTSVGAVYWRDLRKLKLPLPPLSEQRRITEILSTWDRAIEKVETLIANARAQKQALMQQLLPQGPTPPKKRLPGFSGEWRTLRIGDVAKEISERAGEEAGYPVLSCSKYDGMVESLSYFKKKVYSDDTSNYKVMRRGTFGFPSNHIEEGSIGYQDLFDAGIVSPIYCVFATDEQVDNGFLYKLLKTDRYRQIFAAATNASVDRRGSLRWKEFSRIPLPLPPLEEQRAINEAVNAVADVERGYETQLTALRQEKAALMQQLLTGKRRVKLPESEVA